ncbi:MAG: hypothetical protein KKC18_06825 [Chloroflexi bacterium]|nr:hypothetical protein [Chloroflexota bacterium]
MTNLWDGAEVIYAYTRAQALADGVLVEVPPEMAEEAGFTCPVACTSALYMDVITPGPNVEAGQSIDGRLWDALYMLHMAITQALPGSRTFNGPGPCQTTLYPCGFTMGDNAKAQLFTIKAVCGPDDDLSPCITLMLENES